MQKLNPKFYTVFTVEELDSITKNASAVTDDVIVIGTEEYFIEISADLGETLDIYYNRYSDERGEKITKERFLELYQDASILDTKVITLNELKIKGKNNAY